MPMCVWRAGRGWAGRSALCTLGRFITGVEYWYPAGLGEAVQDVLYCDFCRSGHPAVPSWEARVVYITVRWEKSLCTLPTPPRSQPRLVMEAVVQNPGGSIRSHHPCALGAHTIGTRYQ